MRRWWIPVGGAATLLLAACPYHGKVPLGPPEPGQFDERLLGEWVSDSVPESQGGRARLWIARFDGDGYVVAGLGSCPAGGGRAHLTVLEDRTFLNVREESEAGLYSIGRVELEGDGLRLTQLSDSLEDVSTSDSLRARLLARWDDRSLYEAPVSYRRTDRPMSLSGSDAMSMLAQACPYDDEVLLEEEAPAAALDAFVGRWREDAGWTSEYEVTRLAGGHAQIVATGSAADLSDSGPLEVYATRIGNALFLNAREDEDGTGWLGRLVISGDTAEIRLINAGVRVDSPAALRRFLAERLEDPSIYYWEPVRWVRK